MRRATVCGGRSVDHGVILTLEPELIQQIVCRGGGFQERRIDRILWLDSRVVALERQVSAVPAACSCRCAPWGYLAGVSKLLVYPCNAGGTGVGTTLALNSAGNNDTCFMAMVPSLFDSAFTPLAQALQVRAERQQVLAGNIANVDTPGYRARDIDFRAAMAAELAGTAGSLNLRRTESRQLPGIQTDGLAPFIAYRTGLSMGIDGNNVELAREEARFTANALAYQADLKFLSGRIRNLRQAITGNV